MGQTCLLLRRVTTAVTALKVRRSRLRPPRQRSTALSCSRGCGSITGGMPAGRAGWLWRSSLRRAVSLRRGRALRHRGHLHRPPVTGSRLLTPETGTATLILSVSLHPRLIRVAPRPRPQPLMPGQPSSRMGIHLRQVWLRLTMSCCSSSSSSQWPTSSNMLFSLQYCMGFVCVS